MSGDCGIGSTRASSLKRFGLVVCVAGALVATIVAVAPSATPAAASPSAVPITTGIGDLTSTTIIGDIKTDLTSTTIIGDIKTDLTSTTIIGDITTDLTSTTIIGDIKTDIVIDPCIIDPSRCQPKFTTIFIDPCIIYTGCTSTTEGTPAPSTTLIIDPCEVGVCAPPPLLPPVERAKLTVARGGNGTITGSGINCGSMCVAEFDSGAQASLRAKAAAGWKLGGWEAACAGTIGDMCTVTVKGETLAKANFVPGGDLTPPSVEIKRAIFQVRWAESLFRGSFLIQGSVKRPDQLTIRLARTGRTPSSTAAQLVPAKTIKVRVQGSFKKTVKLPASLLPGRYAVKITSKSGLKQSGAVNLPAPPEGVVAKASASAAENGTPATKLTGDQRELWVRFAFAAFPKASLPLTVSWFLNDQLVAPPVQKSTGPQVGSFIRSSSTMPKGTWKAVLQAGDRIVKTISVQLA